MALFFHNVYYLQLFGEECQKPATYNWTTNIKQTLELLSIPAKETIK